MRCADTSWDPGKPVRGKSFSWQPPPHLPWLGPGPGSSRPQSPPCFLPLLQPTHQHSWGRRLFWKPRTGRPAVDLLSSAYILSVSLSDGKAMTFIGWLVGLRNKYNFIYPLASGGWEPVEKKVTEEGMRFQNQHGMWALPGQPRGGGGSWSLSSHRRSGFISFSLFSESRSSYKENWSPPTGYVKPVLRKTWVSLPVQSRFFQDSSWGSKGISLIRMIGVRWTLLMIHYREDLQ